MRTTLNHLRTGEKGTVADISVSETLEKRLRDFGIVAGTQVMCAYRSPGADLTAIAARGSVVALRTNDLKKIAVIK